VFIYGLHRELHN
jgi:hypothetical protein